MKPSMRWGKAAAFAEFHRVVRPDGRLSLFEPINRSSNPLVEQGHGKRRLAVSYLSATR